MALTRAGVQPRPQNLVSYSNPNAYSPNAYGAIGVGETLLALAAGGAMAATSYPPPVFRNGLVPLYLAALTAAAM